MIYSTNYNQQAALELICQITGISIERIRSKDRHSEVVMARQCLATVLRQHLGMQWTAIAAFLGRPGAPMDHSTMIYAVRRFNGLLYVKDDRACDLWDVVISRLDSVVDSGCRVMVRALNTDLQKLTQILERNGFYYEVV